MFEQEESIPKYEILLFGKKINNFKELKETWKQNSSNARKKNDKDDSKYDWVLHENNMDTLIIAGKALMK